MGDSEKYIVFFIILALLAVGTLFVVSMGNTFFSPPSKIVSSYSTLNEICANPVGYVKQSGVDKKDQRTLIRAMENWCGGGLQASGFDCTIYQDDRGNNHPVVSCFDYDNHDPPNDEICCITDPAGAAPPGDTCSWTGGHCLIASGGGGGGGGGGGSGGPTPCDADLNNDGTVGPDDLAILLGNWGPCADPDNCPMDFDGDGNVGPFDLAFLLGWWGTECPGECVTPPGGMVSWWDADSVFNDGEVLTILDIADDNPGIATNIGPVFLVPDGKVGWAFNFNGIAEHIVVPDADNLDVTSMTIDAWIKRENEVSDKIVFSKGEGSESNYQLSVSNEGEARCRVSTQLGPLGVGNLGIPESYIPEGEWVHIACTFNETNGMLKIYIDGEFIASNSYGPDPNPLVTNNHDFLIGFQLNGQPDEYFDGLIDEVEIFDRALSEDEIWDIYNADSAGKCKPGSMCTPPPSEMVSWWPLDEIDYLGDIWDGNDGIAFGALGVESGKVGEAILFGEGYILVPDSDNLDVTSITIDAWIKPDILIDNWEAIVFKRSEVNNALPVYSLFRQAEGFVFQINTGGSNIATGPVAIPIGEWSHIAGTYDGEVIKTYLNGEEVISDLISGPLVQSAQNLFIGAANSDSSNEDILDQFFNGFIDEVEIFNRALSADEIWDIYYADSAGKCRDAECIQDSDCESDGNACTITSCENFQCVTSNVNDGTNCNDGMFCTFFDHCVSGQCISVDPNPCEDGLSCTIGLCDEVSDTCSQDTSQCECSVDSDCNDDVSCTGDECNEIWECEFIPDDGMCIGDLACDEEFGCVQCVEAPHDMVSWWRGDGNAEDLQNGNNGLEMNGVSYVDGKVGEAFSFDGVDDYVRVQDHFSLDVTSVTIDAWVNPNPEAIPPGDGYVVAFKQGAYTLSLVDIFGFWEVRCSVDTINGDTVTETGINEVPVSEWTHIACTYDETTGEIFIYLDGNVDDGSGGAENQPIMSSGSDLIIGSTGYEVDNFNGLIDEVEIFGRALIQSEIESIYLAGAAGKCKVPVCGNGVLEPGEECELGSFQGCPLCTQECVYDFECCTGEDCCIGGDCCGDDICIIEECKTCEEDCTEGEPPLPVPICIKP